MQDSFSSTVKSIRQFCLQSFSKCLVLILASERPRQIVQIKNEIALFPTPPSHPKKKSFQGFYFNSSHMQNFFKKVFYLVGQLHFIK